MDAVSSGVRTERERERGGCPGHSLWGDHPGFRGRILGKAVKASVLISFILIPSHTVRRRRSNNKGQ